MPTHNLDRFLTAQQNDYQTALTEIKAGRKRSHWMWYIFPQIDGLGLSENSKYYAIRDIAEATAFFDHPVLGSRLVGICRALLDQHTNDAHKIFGSPDDMKLRSSMTLFASIPRTDPAFTAVLQKFFNGQSDQRTLDKLNQAGGTKKY